MESYATVPDGVVLDIDDTCDVVHGHQQLSLFNAHYDQRGFFPIHVYDSAPGRRRAAAGQDAVWHRGAGASAPHPRPLASHPHHHPGRQSLCPS